MMVSYDIIIWHQCHMMISYDDVRWWCQMMMSYGSFYFVATPHWTPLIRVGSAQILRFPKENTVPERSQRGLGGQPNHNFWRPANDIFLASLKLEIVLFQSFRGSKKMIKKSANNLWFLHFLWIWLRFYRWFLTSKYSKHLWFLRISSTWKTGDFVLSANKIEAPI